jgi:hypothetical protein
MNKLQKLAAGTSASLTALVTTAGAVFAQNNATSKESSSGIGTVITPVGFADNLGAIITFILRLTMFIAILLVLFYLISGAIEWITSGGEKGKTEAARNKITTAVIGLVVLAATYAIFTLLLQIFFGQSNIEGAFGALRLNETL